MNCPITNINNNDDNLHWSQERSFFSFVFIIVIHLFHRLYLIVEKSICYDDDDDNNINRMSKKATYKSNITKPNLSLIFHMCILVGVFLVGIFWLTCFSSMKLKRRWKGTKKKRSNIFCNMVWKLFEWLNKHAQFIKLDQRSKLICWILWTMHRHKYTAQILTAREHIKRNFSFFFPWFSGLINFFLVLYRLFHSPSKKSLLLCSNTSTVQFTDPLVIRSVFSLICNMIFLRRLFYSAVAPV